MEGILKQLFKNGMEVKCSLIGKLNLLTAFKEDLSIDDDIESDIKGFDLQIKDKGEVIFILSVEDNRLKFFPSPKIHPLKKISIIQCLFDSFMYHFSDYNEDLIQLEEDGVHIVCIDTENYQ